MIATILFTTNNRWAIKQIAYLNIFSFFSPNFSQDNYLQSSFSQESQKYRLISQQNCWAKNSKNENISLTKMWNKVNQIMKYACRRFWKIYRLSNNYTYGSKNINTCVITANWIKFSSHSRSGTVEGRDGYVMTNYIAVYCRVPAIDKLYSW